MMIILTIVTYPTRCKDNLEYFRKTKKNHKLKNANVLFLRRSHNSVISFRKGASKVILNDSSVFYFTVTRQLSINWMCFL